jgi:class 3 adenylate cyclase/tetratricopeptide (TPR) repeat protein
MTHGEPPPVRGERRPVTILFADLSNFSGLGERLDPEDVAALIRECFRGVIEEIRACDGWIEKHIGDAVLAVFGAPVAHEDDPVRAVRAALAIRDRVDALNRRVREQIGGPLEVHVGINTGLTVIVPAVEGGDGDDFIVVGDTVNTAARLQQAAGPGQIIVGEQTHSATDWCYAYQQLAPLKLKGKQGRVAAWTCLGERPSPGDRRRLARGGRSRFVDRTAERAALRGCLETLGAGRGGLALVTGDPGIGKTRLLADARDGAENRGILWLEGRTGSFGEPVAYTPFIEVLRQLVGIGRDDGDEDAWQKLEQHVRELFAEHEVADVLPYLGLLLGLELPDELSAVRYLEGEGVGLQLFRATRLLFERVARNRPVAVVFEDWHWTDESSAALLEHLLPLARSLPILFCCSSRFEQSPLPSLREWASDIGLEERAVYVELEPLSPDDAHVLISSLPEQQSLPQGLHDEIVETTEGNPFFIEEIVRSLTHGGRPVEGLVIPETLRGAIIARIDRLGDDTREVLRAASVLGRSFSYRLLLELVPEHDVDRALEEAAEADLVREVAQGGERELAFKHAVTHDVVYANVLLAQRRELHLQVALLLERVFADRLDELAGTVAFHYTQAKEWDRAQTYLFRAGDHAGSIAASAEALAYYGRAVEAYKQSGHEWDARERAELDRKMGEAFFRRGEHDLAAKYLEQALACLGFGYPRTQAGVRMTIARAAARQLVHRLLPLARYRRISDEPDPWMDELSRILDTLGWIYFFSNPERVVLDSFRQLNTAERRGHRLAIVRASTGLGLAFDTLPARSLAGSYHRRSVALSSTLENRRSVGIAYLGLAHHQRYQLGALDDALHNFLRAREECQRAGDLRSRMCAVLMVAEVTALMGDVRISLGHGRQLIEIGEDAGDSQVRGWGHHTVGRALYLVGALDQAQAQLERACELSERVPDYQALFVARGNLGLVLIEQGSLDDALTVLEPTLRLAQERRLRTFARTDLLKALAKAYLLEAEQAPAVGRDQLLRRAKRACRELARQERLDCAAAPAARRMEGTYHWLRGKSARADERWRRSIAAAEALGAPYELAVTQLEAGRRATKDALVAHGHRLLSELASRAAVDDPSANPIELSKRVKVER